MTIPDLNDRAVFPPFRDLPEDAAAASSDAYLLAQIKDNMTITKPTLVLIDRDSHPFALVFEGFDRDGLDLAKLGLKKGATAVIRNPYQSVPLGSGDPNEPETMTSKAAKRPFIRIAAGQAHTVQAVPGGLEQTLAAAEKLRGKQSQSSGSETCDACGSAGDGAKLLKCTGCQQAQYCNRACQTKGWSDRHKGECKAWRALATIWA